MLIAAAVFEFDMDISLEYTSSEFEVGGAAEAGKNPLYCETTLPAVISRSSLNSAEKMPKKFARSRYYFSIYQIMNISIIFNSHTFIISSAGLNFVAVFMIDSTVVFG